MSEARPWLTIAAAVEAAIRAVPPAWPLSAQVAVNPFLGHSEEPLEFAQARLRRVAGTRITPERAWYREQIAAGAIGPDDLGAGLDALPAGRRPVATAAELAAAAERPAPEAQAVPTVAELVRRSSGIDWPGLMADRIGAWAAGYFDAGQALWAAQADRGVWAAWRSVASQDLTPEIQGLKGFARQVADTPDTADRAIASTVARLGVPGAAQETFFHRLLMTLGGWAQYGRYRLWQTEQAGATDTVLRDLLAIRLVWEDALFRRYADEIGNTWEWALAVHSSPIRPDAEDCIDAALQRAAEQAQQRRLTIALGRTALTGSETRPAVQAAFCIDVRSEVFRRALESVDEGIRTLGCAGFFGLAVEHRRFASDVPETRAPVLLEPLLRSRAGGDELAEADRRSRWRARAKRAWGRFKLAAVSSFAFVEAMGPVYVARLLRDALGGRHHAGDTEPAPQLTSALDEHQRTGTAEQVLRTLSLTHGFARLVVFAGHGATVTNNPFASALQCGACGGHSGEVNARLLAGLLNDPAVRAGLAGRGIAVPSDTLFLAALHDTTTDQVKLYDGDADTSGHGAELDQFQRALDAAGVMARSERLRALPGGGDAERRARDWAEVRPEWGLAGCRFFLAAPRALTEGRRLDGHAFLHDYDWHRDEGFAVLETILTAPVVVASWISLQYYGSAVAPEIFGAGNKLLHNVTGGIGVVEGNGGLLRTGLPWQSVHDGERRAHAPLRMTVGIAAPVEAITGVLEHQDKVRALFDHGWLHLLALGDDGAPTHRYSGGLRWTVLKADCRWEAPAQDCPA